ncbi:plasmid mobilization protein [Aeromonas caviae]
MTEIDKKSGRSRGRKSLPDDQKRKHGITCRLTDDELAHVDRLRGQMTAGEWIRTAALSQPPRIVPEINIAAWQELARAAANLNQLARLAHQQALGLPELSAGLAAFRVALLGADLGVSHEG